MTQLRLAALTLVALSATLVVGPRTAHAEGQRVVLLHDGPRVEALADGLRVELAGTRAEVLVVAAPTGETPLLRAGAAQAIARGADAAFAIWVERQPTEGAGDLLRVVDPESDHIRDAPLPAPVAHVEPRTFAAVAASLIGELLDPTVPPPGPIRVYVRVQTPAGDVEVDAIANPNAETAAPLSQPTAHPASELIVVPVPTTNVGISEPPPAELDDGGALMPRAGFTLSASVVTAIIATGGELSLGIHLNRFLRLDLVGLGVVQYVDDPSPAGTFGLALTRIGASRSGRFDIGGFVSLLIVENKQSVGSSGMVSWPESSGDVVTFTESSATFGLVTGAHIGWMWELSRGFGLGFRFAAGASFVGDDPSVVPFGMLSFRTEIGL